MIKYTNEQYVRDLAKIKDEIESMIMRGHVNINIVGLHRGSLPMAVHLSNILPAKMSIVNYQTRDGDSTEPVFALDTIALGDTIIVLDDIYDSGKTIRDTVAMIRQKYPDQYVKPMVLFGKDNEDDCSWVREHTGEWINFPWEVELN